MSSVRTLWVALACIALLPVNASAGSDEIARRDQERVQTHRASLTTDQQREIARTMRALVKSKRWLNEVSTAPASHAPVFLLVHGLGLEEDTPAWEKPIHQLRSQGRQGYFFKWSKWRGLRTSADRLVSSIREIRAHHPGRKLVIVAHSAGGVISMLALDRLQPLAAQSEIFLHTAASPLFGYQAPAVAFFGAPFVGRATIELGRGSREVLEHSRLIGCTNWVNLRCELDKHACPRKGISPQGGSLDQRADPLPCESVQMGEWTHNEIIQQAMNHALASTSQL